MDTQLPVNKQTRTSDYFEKENPIIYNVPIRNSFEPLADCLEDAETLKEPEMGCFEVRWKEVLELQEINEEKARETERIINNYADFTAKTVTRILKRVTDLQTNANSLISKTEQLKTVSSYILSLGETEYNSKWNKQSVQTQGDIRTANQILVLQRNKICLTMCPFREKKIWWRNKQGATKHLRNIFVNIL